MNAENQNIPLFLMERKSKLNRKPLFSNGAKLGKETKFNRNYFTATEKEHIHIIFKHSIY